MTFVYVFICFVVAMFFVMGSIHIAVHLDKKYNSHWFGVIFLTIFYGLVIATVVEVSQYKEGKENKVENVVDKCEK